MVYIVSLLLLILLHLINLLLEVGLHLPTPQQLLVCLLDFIVQLHLLIDYIGGIESLAIFVHPVVLLLYCLSFSL